MSAEVLRVLKAEFSGKKYGGAGKTNGSNVVTQAGAKGLPAQENNGIPYFGIKGRAPLTQDMFEYKGQKLTKTEAQHKSYADVFRHESAHLSKAGKYATTGIHIDFDGNGMATSGHVGVAIPFINPKNLKETIEHAKTVIASAEAPASFDELSGADKAVAAQSRSILSKAIAMKAKQEKQSLGSKFNRMA